MSDASSFLPFIASYLAQRVSNFSLRPSHPHRVIHDRPEPIAAYHARLSDLYARSPYGNGELIGNLIRDIMIAAIEDTGRLPSNAVFEAYGNLLRELLVDNELCFALPTLDHRLIRDPNYATPLRRRLNELEPLLVHKQPIIETFCSITITSLAAITTHYLPASAFNDPSPSTFTLPLSSLIGDLRDFVQRVVFTFLNHDQQNTTEPYSLAFWNTRHQIFENLLSASHLTFEQANKNPHKIVVPSSSDRSTDDLVRAYLGGTPFVDFLQTSIPFELTSRFSHHHIVATPGAGKTNLIGVLLAKDFDAVADGKASVIVLDSQGDLIKSIVLLKDFAPGGRLHDRLVYIDPTDIEYPLQLNFFARSGSRALTPLAKRTEHSDLVELLLFLFGALKQEATGRQETLIKAVASLIQEIQDATLMTLNEIFEPNERNKPALHKFSAYLARLDPALRKFFAVDFNSSEFSQSRGQIRARIQSLITDPIFRTMFEATSQRLDFAKEMNAGKVILINAHEDLLKTGTEVFGRFFIALAAQAAQARQNIPEHARLATYFYIDECYKFIKEDTNVETILDTGRKYRLGVIIAHQRLKQLSEALKSAASSAAIKMVRAPVFEDANTLASQLNMTADGFDALPAYAFATRITGMRKPVALSVPVSPLADAEHMTDAEFAELKDAMRRKYARASQSLQPAPTSAYAQPFPPDDSDNAPHDDTIKPGKEW